MTTATRTAHNNTDRSNAYCYCAIGADHGNLPAQVREGLLRHLLAAHDIQLESTSDYTMIRAERSEPLAKISKTLRQFGFDPQTRISSDEGGRGLRISAAAFTH